MNRKRRFALTENMGVVINSDFFKRNTDIVVLDLSYGFISELPEEILLLEDLESLSIANTQISFLPIELGSLRYLENIVTDNSSLGKKKKKKKKTNYIHLLIFQRKTRFSNYSKKP